MARFGSLKNLLKQKNQGYQKKKASLFKEDEISPFLNDAIDERYLAHKLLMILGLSGSCWTQKLYNIKISDTEEIVKWGLGKLVMRNSNQPARLLFRHLFQMYAKRSLAFEYQEPFIRVSCSSTNQGNATIK